MSQKVGAFPLADLEILKRGLHFHSDGLLPFPGDTEEAGARRIAIHVVATTAEGTTSALAEARLILLVPHVVHYAAPLGHPPEDPAVIAEQHSRLATTASVEATVLLRFCRSREDEAFAQSSIVLVGGRRGWWWPSAEQRLARRLRRRGHLALFAEVRRSTAPRSDGGRSSSEC